MLLSVGLLFETNGPTDMKKSVRTFTGLWFAFAASGAIAQNSVPPAASPIKSEHPSPRWTNEALGRLPSRAPLADPTGYYGTREKAIALARSEDWTAAQPLLEKLVSQYPDDGDTWYLLGIGNMQTGRWSGAISAFENVLRLGTALRGIPTGSPPSNDVMTMIAEAYAALGDSENATLWMDRALAARYDDRPSLSGRAHFASALSPDDYGRMLGADLASDLSRDERWRADLHMLQSEIRRLHVDLESAIGSDELASRVEALDARIPALSDQQIVVEFMRIMGALGSGHNLLVPTGGRKGSLSRLPLEFYLFADGLFIVEADDQHKHLIGSQVLKLGDVSAEDALARAAVFNARDNEMQQLWLAPYYISLPDILCGLAITACDAPVPLTIRPVGGEQRTIELTGGEWAFQGFPRLPKLRSEAQPLYLRNHDRLYWSQSLPDRNALYAQFNWVQENEEQTLAQFSRRLIKALDDTNAQNLILDLRLNQGGDGSILPPLIRAMVYFQEARPNGKLFIMAGRGTFSAAHDLLTDLDRLTDAIIVGEPSGSRPNALGEAGRFVLPHSGLLGIVSTQFHQTSGPEDHRIWIAPDVPVAQTSGDYFAGEDGALDAIFEIIDRQHAGAGNIRDGQR